MENNEINNNEQKFTDSNATTNKPKSKFLKTVLIIVGVIAALLLLVFGIYKGFVDVANKNSDKFDYNLNEELTEIKKYNLSYDSKKDPNTLLISIPKVYAYEKIIDIRALAKDFDDKYELHINRIGFNSNENEANVIDFYADVTYKKYLNTFVSGQMDVLFTDENGLKFVLKHINIGKNIPESLYKSLLPIKSGDIIYEIDPNKFEFLKDKLLDLKLISNISIDKENICFDFDVMSNVDIIVKYIFGDDAVALEEIVHEIFPAILDAIINAEE